MAGQIMMMMKMMMVMSVGGHPAQEPEDPGYVSFNDI